MSVALTDCVWRADTVQRLGDSLCGRSRLLPSVQRHHLGHQRRGRASVDAPARSDHSTQRARHQEPLRDIVRPRKHQPLHAGWPAHVAVGTFFPSVDVRVLAVMLVV